MDKPFPCHAGSGLFFVFVVSMFAGLLAILQAHAVGFTLVPGDVLGRMGVCVDDAFG